MGVCQSSKEKRPKYHKSSSIIGVDQIPEENSPEVLNDNKPIERYLIDGNTAKIRELIERKEIDVNSYDFEGSIMTILHKAVQISDNPDLIDLILSKGAQVDAEEKETGNTALMIASIDYKDEIVKVLLKYSPNLDKKNKKGQNIFSYLKYFFNDKQGIKQTDLSSEQKYRVDKILRMLNENKKEREVENLDDDENMKLNADNKVDQDDSGFAHNRL
jgi:ankyrin repeat protein